MIKLGNKYLKWPLIQGGMGVGISLSSLAGAVMKEGAMGVISAAHPGYRKPNFLNDSLSCNIEALYEEIAKAKQIAQKQGLCGVNIMVASKDYQKYVEAAVDAGADAIISGAGLPLELPKFVRKQEVLLAPIVSSAKAAILIIETWIRHYTRIPDFIVVEGSEAGGHLGFKKETLLSNSAPSLHTLIQEVKTAILPYEQQYQTSIPIFAAGGVYTKEDIQACIQCGASGVQMATRFIVCEECDADIRFKQAIIDAKEEDIQLVISPAGLPGRGIMNPYMKEVMQGIRKAPSHCVRCIKPCHPATTPYCISEALIHAVKGELDNALIFCGTSAIRIHEMTSVKQLMDELFERE